MADTVLVPTYFSGFVFSTCQYLCSPDVTGAILTDAHGLGLLGSPHLTPETAGIVTAIGQHAARIEERDENPIINFEGDTRQCLIKREGSVTTAIFKNAN